jgi:branched-chain amino acid transport system substrate-binding protein
MAIESVGTLDREKVRGALASGKFQTFFAPVAFSKQGYATSYQPPIFQVQGGKPVVLFPPAVKQAEFAFGVN